jgi:hypothetical protein
MMNRVIFQDRNLSSLGGLLLFKDLLAGSRLDERVGEALPRQRIASGASGFDKFRALLLGFLSGAECLEDMDRLCSDPMFREELWRLSAQVFGVSSAAFESGALSSGGGLPYPQRFCGAFDLGY